MATAVLDEVAGLMVEDAFDPFERPPAGTACRDCLKKHKHRHFCPASVYMRRGEGEVPLCGPCATGSECGARAAVRSLADPLMQFEDVPAPSEVRHIDPQTVTVTPVPTQESKPWVSDEEHDQRQRQAKKEAAALIREVEKRKTDRRRADRNTRAKQRREEKAEVSAVEATQREDAPMEDAAQTKKCAKEGCPYNASRRGSYCTQKHFYHLKKELGELGKPAPKGTVGRPSKAAQFDRAERATAASPAWDGDKAGMATLQVPNAALDRFWNALTYSEKAAIVARQIAGI